VAGALPAASGQVNEYMNMRNFLAETGVPIARAQPWSHDRTGVGAFMSDERLVFAATHDTEERQREAGLRRMAPSNPRSPVRVYSAAKITWQKHVVNWPQSQRIGRQT
jgi:hypothetical protein